MSLVLYNNMTKTKEKFVPLSGNKVTMYCCGPTVYGYLHVGNFRGAIFYNLLRNWLEVLGYKVTYVYNYTDVDDKIIDKANQENVTPQEISERYIKAFEEDYGRLGLKPHDKNPKVSEYMKPIVEMIGELVKKDKAYHLNGEVLYSIKAFEGYGKLSGRNPDELKAGVRIEMDGRKKDPLDFALWKPAKAGEPSWPSPWSAGRPGWHIECSAMARSILGDQIDIHGGGLDLIFPHHENEIAQTEGCTGKKFSNFWLHHNMLNFGGAKMSKSLGNIKAARAFLDEYHPEIFKMMILQPHYRSVSDFSEVTVENAIRGLARFYSALALAESLLGAEALAKAKKSFKGFESSDALKSIAAALNDDVNTPEVFARMYESVRLFNSKVRRGQKADAGALAKCEELVQTICGVGELMALFQQPPSEFLKELDDLLLLKKNLSRDTVQKVVDARKLARDNKDFKKSDELRAELAQLGISVSDTPEGSFWEVTK